MAHECPECGQACYCGGDIDDIVLTNTVAERNCEHCGVFEDDDEDDDVGEDHDEDDDADWPEHGYEVED